MESTHATKVPNSSLIALAIDGDTEAQDQLSARMRKLRWAGRHAEANSLVKEFVTAFARDGRPSSPD